MPKYVFMLFNSREWPIRFLSRFYHIILIYGPRLLQASIFGLKRPGWYKKITHAYILIDGYPRSANTFMCEVFYRGNPDIDDKIAHHSHSSIITAIACRHGIPVILLIRHPLDAIRSYLIFQMKEKPINGMLINHALQQYADFYNDLYSLRDNFLIADFETVIKNPQVVINRCNRKFNTSFKYIEDTEQAIYTYLDDEKPVTCKHVPDPVKEQLKEKIEIDQNGALYKRALQLYHLYQQVAS